MGGINTVDSIGLRRAFYSFLLQQRKPYCRVDRGLDGIQRSIDCFFDIAGIESQCPLVPFTGLWPAMAPSEQVSEARAKEGVLWIFVEERAQMVLAHGWRLDQCAVEQSAASCDEALIAPVNRGAHRPAQKLKIFCHLPWPGAAAVLAAKITGESGVRLPGFFFDLLIDENRSDVIGVSPAAANAG